jgi:hypothetical protein
VSELTAERERITEEWLRANGFRWHQLERQCHKMWTLWLGDAVAGENGFSSYEDLGVEVANCGGTCVFTDKWNCWLRSDYAHRYSRFVHIRNVKFVDELAALVEGVTGLPFDAANNVNGCAYRRRDAERLLQTEERLDLRWLRECRKWYLIEEDDSRGRALPEHYEFHEKAKTKEQA